MKVSRVSVWILGGAALTAGAIVFSSWNWSLRSEAELRLQRAIILETRTQSLRAEITAGTQRIQSLLESLRVTSNRVAEVESLLEVEKQTHDPIRRQIETMLAEQIGLKDNLGKRDKSLAGLNTSMNELQKTNKELLTQVKEREGQIAQFEKDLKGAAERESAMQTQLGEARNNATKLQTKLDETQRRLADSERLASELQKQKQALEAVPATNTAVTVSAP